MKNYAVIGRMRTGKDTVAAYLQEKYGHEIVAFGDALKEDYHREFNAPTYPKPRKGYQLYGQLMRYVYGEDHWIKQLQARKLSGRNQHHVITDVRQPNEYEWALENKYIIIKMTSHESYVKQRILRAGDRYDPEDAFHETEMHVDNFEGHIEIKNNYHTVNELRAALDKIFV
jgi:dephospho-CoA kinase